MRFTMAARTPPMDSPLWRRVDGYSSTATRLQYSIELREALRVIGEHHQTHRAYNRVEACTGKAHGLPVFHGKRYVGQPFKPLTRFIEHRD